MIRQDQRARRPPIEIPIETKPAAPKPVVPKPHAPKPPAPVPPKRDLPM